MPRRIEYPHGQGYWIELPDEWLGRHANRRDEVLSKLPAETGQTESNFAVAMALLDDWVLPGLNGNPEKWDFSQLSLNMIAWVSQATIGDFNQCWVVKKNS
jgi:hypothetical protein